ncbi:hypothetical protein ECG_07454 [Echinococcus granulosus]|nr:hypothetical protein ECG_07454 [Echinococcus granulosus]
MYRQISQLRNQLEQQGQLIQTLFNFLSAIASDRRNSGIRIGSGKRKLALTGHPQLMGSRLVWNIIWIPRRYQKKLVLYLQIPN